MDIENHKTLKLLVRLRSFFFFSFFLVPPVIAMEMKLTGIYVAFSHLTDYSKHREAPAGDKPVLTFSKAVLSTWACVCLSALMSIDSNNARN